MRALLLLCLALASCYGEAVDVDKRKYKPDPYPEGGTDPVIHSAEPVVLAARKFRSLVDQNEAVATCRYILFKAKKTFYEAKDHCNTIEWPFTHRGIGMASISSAAENHDITQLLKEAYGIKRTGGPYHRDNWAWIGLSKRLNNDRKLENNEKGNFNASEWFWSDEEKATYSKWAYKMPDQQYSKKYNEFQVWVQINKRGHWDDTYASIKAPFACEYCGRYIVFEKRLTWDKAEEKCTELGLGMAVIDSEEDNREFAWAVDITFGSRGVEDRRFNPMNWIWIGSKEVMDADGVGTGVWVHYDNSTIDWEPVWDRKRQPDNMQTKKLGEQSVAAYSRLDAKWDDSFSRGRKRPFACMCPYTCSFPYDEFSVNNKATNSGRQTKKKTKKTEK